MRHLSLLLAALPLLTVSLPAQIPGTPVRPAAPTAPATAVAPTKLPAADPAALIGKPPPPFTVARWVKGEPLTKFEKGKVYVVDFWATWCGPCKAAIPHLTRLQQEHPGTVEVIGVSISERQKNPEDEAYLDLVQQFVDGQGERMDYRVAVDTKDKQMHTAWFKPAGTGGIPTAYVIDQNGLVAWVGIGSPATVERIVKAVLAGSYDPKVEAAQQAKAEAESKQRAEADIAKARANADKADAKFPGYQEAMARGDQTAALAALNAAFAAEPKSETEGAYQWKLMLLLQANKPADVEAYARELLQKFPDNDDVIGFCSAVIVHADEGEPRFDARLAHSLAEKTLAMAKPDTRWQQFARWRLGWAQHHIGEREQATKTMLAARDAIQKLKSSIDFGDLDSQCEDALRIFKKPAK
jgi:thiol-disulfide isomerase/thioredoxin